MKKEENVIQTKSYAFAIRIVKFYKFLVEERKEFVLSKQILKSGTSIGANIEEALGAQSEKDFYAKMTISYKEARETKYWLHLLKDTGYIEENIAMSLLNDCEELLKIIGKIKTTIQKRNS